MLMSRFRRGSATAIMGAMLTLVAVQAASATCGATRDPEDVKRAVLEEAASSSTVPPGLALAVARVGSNFKVDALSPAGARGVMQIMPETGRREFGVEPDELWNPCKNIIIGVGFLSRLYEMYGRNWSLALSHYNGGALRQIGGHYRMHGRTHGYIRNVFRFWQAFERGENYLWTANTTENMLAVDASRGETAGRRPESACRAGESEPGCRENFVSGCPPRSRDQMQLRVSPRFSLEKPEVPEIHGEPENACRFGWTRRWGNEVIDEGRFK